MNRPTVEVADIFRVESDNFIDQHTLGIQQLKVIRAITRCRTAALGGHADLCPNCKEAPVISYNSCRNRHCNKCQSQARERWMEARRQELLRTRYFHVVFTLPHELHALVLQNQGTLYNLLFRAVAETLREVARNPKQLGAEIGFFGILHTWGQNLLFHPHIHCVIPGGGISPDKQRWIHPLYPFFLPVKALGKVFRAKFVAGLRCAHRKGQLICAGSIQHLEKPQCFSAFLRTLFRQNWVVYAKPAFGGPEQVIRYLGRYTHRVAISNHRLISFDGSNVTFRWRDYPPVPLAPRSGILKRHTSPSAVVFASPDASVTRQLQPAFPYFLHNLTASAATTNGFLHTSLSKIRGNSHSSSTRLVSPRISDER